MITPDWPLLTLGVGLLLFAAILRAYHRRRYGTVSPEPVVILTYHKVQNRLELGGTWLTEAGFQRQMGEIRRSGLPVYHLIDYLDSLARGMTEMRGVVLTFDDGYESVFRGAWPVLVRYGMPACVFLVTGFMGRTNDWDQPLSRGTFRHLSWSQALEMGRNDLVRFGSHGVSHRDLTSLSDGELERELRESREAITEKLGRTPEALCYPFGRSDRRVVAALSEAGYRYGVTVTSRPGWNRRHPLAVARTAMYVTDGTRALRIRLGLESPERYWAEDLNNRMINRFTLMTALFQRREPTRNDP